MPVDTSIYGSIAQPNPLGSMNQMLQAQTSMMGLGLRQQEIQLMQQRAPLIAAQTQNAVNQNQLFQQTFTARQALGELAQKSIDPSSGQMDWNKYGLSISTDPRTAFMARDVIESLTRQKLLDAETFGKNVANAQAITTMLGNAVTPIAMAWNKAGMPPADPKDPSKVDMSELIHQASLLIGQNPALKNQVMYFLAGIKSLPKQQVLPALNEFSQSIQIAQKGLNSVYKPFAIDAGDATVMGTQNVMGAPGSAMTESGRVTHTMSPEQLNSLVTSKDAISGAEQKTPRGALPLVGGTVPEVQGPDGQPASGAHSVQAVPITGRPQSTEMAQPQSVAGPALTNPGSMTFQTGPSTYQQNALEKIANEYEPDLNKRVLSANQMLGIMTELQGLLKNFKPGGGESQFLALAKLAQSLGVPQEQYDKLVSSITSGGGLGSVEAARKLFIQLGTLAANQIVQHQGGPAQKQWDTFKNEASPNIDTDPRGIPKIMGFMRDLANWQKMESNYFNMKKDLAGAGAYNLTHVRNDWANVLGEIIARRSRAQNSGAPVQ